jgi:periplasmic protein CpxP/Spy
MDRPFATLFLAALCSSAPGILCALPPTDSAPPLAAMQFPTPDDVVKLLGSKLSLSQDQINTIAPIIADRQQQMKTILADHTTGAMAQRRKAKEVFAESDAKINAVLTPDQREGYAAIEQQILAQMKQRVQ